MREERPWKIPIVKPEFQFLIYINKSALLYRSEVYLLLIDFDTGEG